tara:strand:- start:316 stop:531 length:216 start_codon:yes stop_codon:yes gene_type:complete
MKKKTIFETEVEFKKDIMFPKYRALRLLALLSFSTNMFLLLCMWILEARISKLENKHVDSSSLNIKFNSKE